MQENCVYDNDLRDTDKSTQMKPLDKTEVPKREEYSVYENAHFNMGQPEELYGNLWTSQNQGIQEDQKWNVNIHACRWRVFVTSS